MYILTTVLRSTETTNMIRYIHDRLIVPDYNNIHNICIVPLLEFRFDIAKIVGS